MDAIDELREEGSPNVREGVPLAPFTTFRIGGPAEYFLEARSAEEAERSVLAARRLNLPVFLLGGGSNLLVSDEGVKGLTVRFRNDDLSIDGETVSVGAGMPSGRLASLTARAGLSGMEWMIGLPGTVGGAVRGNAGMFGSETRDRLESVAALSDEGLVREVPKAECNFGYRDSAFKRLPGTAILSARFRLAADDPEACRERMRGFLERKAKTQPVSGLTAGCTFKNWRPQGEGEIASVRRWLDLDRDEAVPLSFNGTVPAGWIIDRAGLKGMAVGHCRISERHGNFIMNDGQGRASEAIALSSAVKMKVRDGSNGIVLLEDEIEYVGF